MWLYMYVAEKLHMPVMDVMQLPDAEIQLWAKREEILSRGRTE